MRSPPRPSKGLCQSAGPVMLGTLQQPIAAAARQFLGANILECTNRRYRLASAQYGRPRRETKQKDKTKRGTPLVGGYRAVLCCEDESGLSDCRTLQIRQNDEYSAGHGISINYTYWSGIALLCECLPCAQARSHCTWRAASEEAGRR